jgi:hypothetical protein
LALKIIFIFWAQVSRGKNFRKYCGDEKTEAFEPVAIFCQPSGKLPEARAPNACISVLDGSPQNRWICFISNSFGSGKKKARELPERIALNSF